MQKFFIFISALLIALGPPSVFAQENPAVGSKSEKNQLRITGNDAPSYVAAEHFFRQAKNLHQRSAGWSYPVPSPWEVHLLDPMGIKAGSHLEAAFLTAIARAETILSNEFMAANLQTSSKEAFATSQVEVANLKAGKLGEIYVDLLRAFEAEGVAKGRLVTFIQRQVRPAFRGSASLGAGESLGSVREHLESMYQGFDKTVIDSFSNLDPVEVLP